MWMRCIAESLTKKFPAKISTEYTRMGWAYLREGNEAENSPMWRWVSPEPPLFFVYIIVSMYSRTFGISVVRDTNKKVVSILLLLVKLHVSNRQSKKYVSNTESCSSKCGPKKVRKAFYRSN